MFSFFTYRVPFSEVDAMGIVHHSNYARYFERGRVDFLRQMGMPYSEVMKRGLHIPLTDLETTFRKPVKFDDVVLVETRLSELSKARLDFSYRLFVVSEEKPSWVERAPFEGAVHTLGVTHHCVVNDAGRPQPIPADLHSMLSGLIQVSQQ